MFKISTKFLEAAQTANLIPIGKFPLLLDRIMEKLGVDTDDELFTDEELSQLRSRFIVSGPSLQTLLNGCSYAFQQAAFTGTSPDALLNILVDDAGFDEEHAKAMCTCWASESAEYIARLKKTTLGSRQMTGLNYHLNVSMGDSNLLRLQEPTALFEFSLNLNDQSLGGGTMGTVFKPGIGLSSNVPMKPHATTSAGRQLVTSAEQVGQKFTTELTHTELFDFFQQLERVQSQLDAMEAGTKP
jgi:hypothetical protein